MRKNVDIDDETQRLRSSQHNQLQLTDAVVE